MIAVDSLAIRAVGVGKSYPTSWRGNKRLALVDVSFDVPAGSIVALVGVNGAGKSTLLRILAGLTDVDQGEVTVFGRTPRETCRAGRVSYLPDALQWPDHLRLRDFVDASVHLLGRSRAEGDGMLESVGLASRSTSRIRECSRGMRQRLGLGWAMLGGPALMLLDEVFAGLDPGATDDAAGILRRGAESGMTVLFTSHYPEQAEEIADRMILLHEGRVAFSGDRHAVAVVGGWREIFRGKALS